MFGFLTRARAITRIALQPPQPEPGRFGIALVLIVRNEAAHIAEWARFHRLAGVDRFFVYDNGCTDGTISIAADTLGDRLTVIPWNQKLRDARSGAEIHNQVLAYAHAVRNFGSAFRWMTFLDVDEFLVPRGRDLPSVLAGLEACRNISLPWHMFGRSGHMTPPPGGVVANYTRRNPDPMSDAKGLRNFKMIVDPCHVTEMRVHAVGTDGQAMTCNDRGQAFTHSNRRARAFLSTDRIQLNHYYTRSDAELRAKIARGPNLTVPDTDHLRRVLRKVTNIEAGEVADRTAVDWLDARARDG